jgi:NAD(P)-dependent dehydrogenase (short-subunit alcohol dehydrogenase family)
MSRLDDRVTIVTGSGRGIGRAIATKLADEGARVVVNDLDPKPAEETLAALRERGRDGLAVVGDVAAPDFGERLIGATLDRFGGLDILVNNAGYIWVGITRTLAKEWGRYGSTVNCVAFGDIDTRLTRPLDGDHETVEVHGREHKVGIESGTVELMRSLTPLGRRGTVEDAAGAVCLFCLPESDFVTGQVLVCSGGLTL